MLFRKTAYKANSAVPLKCSAKTNCKPTRETNSLQRLAVAKPAASRSVSFMPLTSAMAAGKGPRYVPFFCLDGSGVCNMATDRVLGPRTTTHRTKTGPNSSRTNHGKGTTHMCSTRVHWCHVVCVLCYILKTSCWGLRVTASRRC